MAILACLAAAACAGKRPPKATASPEEVYRQAMAKMAKKRYYAARTLLLDALPRIPPDSRDLLPKVQLAIADSYFEDRGYLNYGEALNGYRTFLTYYPRHEEADRAQYMVGMSMFQQALSPDRDQALTLKAIDEFRRVEELYPASPYVLEARRRIQACHDRLAEHERLIGWFYQRRGAWLAAIDRYRQVLETYPRYDRTTRVLFDLGQCLLQVGNRPEAALHFERLAQEDTRGDYASKARSLLQEFDRARVKEGRKDHSG